MRKSRFSENQIITILKEVEQGRAVKDVCREHSVSEATYYQWKSKYGGMEASDTKRLRKLEDENRRLKQLYADLSLENRALKDVIAKSSNDSRAARVNAGTAAALWTERTAGVSSRWTDALSLSVSASARARLYNMLGSRQMVKERGAHGQFRSMRAFNYALQTPQNPSNWLILPRRNDF